MLRRALVVAVCALALVACDAAEPTPGEMSSQTYRSLVAQDDLTIADVEAAGAIVSEDLERTFVDEGGFPARDVNRCRYARTLHLRTAEEHQYRGTARFCFDAQGRSVSIERHRVDVPDEPAG